MAFPEKRKFLTNRAFWKGAIPNPVGLRKRAVGNYPGSQLARLQEPGKQVRWRVPGWWGLGRPAVRDPAGGVEAATGGPGGRTPILRELEFFFLCGLTIFLNKQLNFFFFFLCLSTLGRNQLICNLCYFVVVFKGCLLFGTKKKHWS